MELSGLIPVVTKQYASQVGRQTICRLDLASGLNLAHRAGIAGPHLTLGGCTPGSDQNVLGSIRYAGEGREWGTAWHASGHMGRVGEG